MIIVLVCGGRDYTDQQRVFNELDKILAYYGDLIILHGASKGADTLAALWAQDRGVHAAAVPARWNHKGKSAGVIRNKVMLYFKPSFILAFPGNRGTADMKMQARKEGIEVFEII